MTQPPVRPPRTDAHRLRDELIARFAAAGLTPVLSTNGSIPSADIELILGVKPGDLRDAWIKPQGVRRLGIMEPHVIDSAETCWCGAKPGQAHTA